MMNQGFKTSAFPDEADEFIPQQKKPDRIASRDDFADEFGGKDSHDLIIEAWINGRRPSPANENFVEKELDEKVFDETLGRVAGLKSDNVLGDFSTEAGLRDVVSPSQAAALSVSAHDLGVVMALLFGGLLLIDVVSGAAVIAPMVGFVGMLFGLGFWLMARIERKTG